MKKPSVFGKYLLLERVNVGGMAEVFIAKAFGVEGFERILAIKKILPTMAEDQEFITMFIDEARISVQLNHANVVHIHELGKYDETYFIAMEYVAGRDVRTILERYRRRSELMPTHQAVFIASKMCEGLDYAHRKKDARGQDLGIIHRDVSPQNILVSYEGEVKIIDFGIAKAANRMQKTQAGILKGKFGYMSPEQVRGMPIDRRSDIFAVGVILYEMLTGEKLFVGESDFSTLEKVRNADVPLPRQLNPDIPPGLEKVLLKALAREPEDRYQWASDLQEDLMRFLLSGEAMYSGKQLSNFMKDAFAEDLLREAEKMERFATVERPEHLEVSNIGPAPRAPRRPGVSQPLSSRELDDRDRDDRDHRYEEISEISEVRDPETEPPRDSGNGNYDLSDLDEIEDKTQLVGPNEDMQAALKELRAQGIPGVQTFNTGNIDDSATSLSVNRTLNPNPGHSESSPGQISDSLTSLIPQPEQRSDPAIPARPRTSTKQQVVIGDAQEYVGETVIGPLPSVSRPEEAPRSRTLDGARRATPPRGEDSAPPAPAPRQARPARVEPAAAPKPYVPRMQAGAIGRPPAPETSSGLPPWRLLAIALVAIVLMAGVVGIVLKVANRKGTGVFIAVPTPGATVRLSNPKSGTLEVANNHLVALAPDVYDITISAPGYRPYVGRLRVETGEPRTFSEGLVPDSAEGPVPGSTTTSSDPAPDKPDTSPSTASAPDPAKGDAQAPADPQRPKSGGPGLIVKPSEPRASDRPTTFVARFETDQPGVEILVGGRSVGKTPNAEAANLVIGQKYTVTAVLAGYKTFDGEFTSNGDPRVRVPIQLEKDDPPPPPPQPAQPQAQTPPKPTNGGNGGIKRQPPRPPEPPRVKGRLACSSFPAGADIFIDGRPTGRQTPVPINSPLELGVGAHKVVFKFGGKSSAPQSVQIKENEVSRLLNVQIQ